MTMLVAASKYSDVRRRASAGVGRRGGRSVSGVPDRPPQLIIPKPGECVSLPEWYWREMREGGMLRRYIEREKSRMGRAIQATALACRDFEQNKRSDFKRRASIPAKLFFRWRAVDPHFWDDPANLKSLKRDNPELAIWN